MKTPYIVCMDSAYVLDAKYIDTKSFSDEDFDNVLNTDYNDLEDQIIEMEPTPFIGVFYAENSESAVTMAAKKYRYDPRVLYADPVS